MPAARSGHERLRRVLDVDSLDEHLDTIEGDDAAWLADAVESARRRNAAELEAATQRSLRHLPRLVRPAARRLLGL